MGDPNKNTNLFDTDKVAYVDSVLNANKKLDWVQRLYDPNTPSIPTPKDVEGYQEGQTSTHLMGHNGKGYVFPHVVRGADGQLQYFSSDDDAENYARTTNTGIQMTPAQAEWFAANGYKTGTGVLPSLKRQSPQSGITAQPTLTQPSTINYSEGGSGNTDPNAQVQQPPQSPPADAGMPDYVTDLRKRAQTGYQSMINSGVKPAKAKADTERFLRVQSFMHDPEIEHQAPKQQLPPDEGVVTEFMKSAWNGFAPATLKLIPDLASMTTNAVGLHSDGLDAWVDNADKWVDENVKAYINPEHEQGIFKQDENGEYHFTNLRSAVNGIGNAIGTVAQFVGLAALTGGTGDLAEAAEGVRLAQGAGDVEALAQATTKLKAVQANLTMTKAISGSLLFAPAIYDDGVRSGLDRGDAARLAFGLSVPLGLLGTVSGAEQKILEKMVAGDIMTGAEEQVINKLSDKGILRGLEGRVKGATMSEADFRTTMKATLTDASAITKKLINSKVAKTAGKEFGQMYLQSAVQTFGEQMYDSLYASDKEAGKGAFGAKEIVSADSGEGVGPSVFGYKVGKKAAMNDVQSGIYGAIIGSAMEMYHTPVVNQSLYGYLDGKIRDGKADEGVGKVKKMADILLSKKKITTEQHAELVGTPAVEGKPAADGQPEVPPQPATKGLIDKMAETSAMLKDVNGDKIDPVASFDVYNYQNNEKPKIEKQIHDFSHPANPDPQANDNGGLVQQLLQLKETDPTNTAQIAALQKKVADGYANWDNNIKKHGLITKHITDTVATGKFTDIRPEIAKIDKEQPKYTDTSHPEIKAAMEGFNQEVYEKAKSGVEPDENGVKYKDLVGEVVTHKELGKGTIVERDNSLPGEEPQKEYYFQPEDVNKHTELLDGNEIVDKNKYDHKLTAPKTEADAVQKPSTEGVPLHPSSENGEGVGEGNTEGEKTPEAQIQKAVDLDSLKDKPVTYKGQKGKLSIDEGGKVSFEAENGRVYDIPTEANNRNATDYGITPIKEKAEKRTTVSDVSETSATVNGTKYTIHTNKKTGNIIGLSPENKPEQIIRNEKLITAVEIERNKTAYQTGETTEDFQKEKSALPQSEHKIVDLVDNIHSKHMDDATSDAIDKLMRGNRISEDEMKLVKRYSEKVGSDLLSLQIEGNNDNSEVLNSAIENIDLLDKQIKQDEADINNSAEANIDGSKEGAKEKPAEPTAEEVRAETVEKEFETKVAEKPIPEEEQKQNSEVAETVINEVAEKDTAVYDALEQGTDVKTDKKVAKEKKAKSDEANKDTDPDGLLDKKVEFTHAGSKVTGEIIEYNPENKKYIAKDRQGIKYPLTADKFTEIADNEPQPVKKVRKAKEKLDDINNDTFIPC